MNSVENRLANVLAEAESGVLKVIADAAVSGDYAAIDRARAVAEKLRDIIDGVDRKFCVADASPAPGKKTRKRRAKSPKKGEYPRFNIEGGSLYKIGWSKKKSDEYIHRVPISKVKQIGRVLENFSGGADPVSTEQILESEFFKEAGSPPSYQIYIVLAFLKDRGAITSVGRDGYQLPVSPMSAIDAVLRKEAA